MGFWEVPTVWRRIARNLRHRNKRTLNRPRRFRQPVWRRGRRCGQGMAEGWEPAGFLHKLQVVRRARRFLSLSAAEHRPAHGPLLFPPPLWGGVITLTAHDR